MKTSDLEEKLNTPGAFDNEMVENNPPPELPDILTQYIDEKNMTKSEVIRILNVARNYGYQILNGTRPITRNILLQISLILKLDIDQINYLLRLAEKPQLYVRNIVDARVFYAVKHNMGYYEALDFIWGKSIV
ncbi:MAG: helix-turn-helix transcriptional regulator [Ruminococcaceae bacterium]|nr:helix-turn-helix transcriptional regulator [Oscillospiraceae bacterium]